MHVDPGNERLEPRYTATPVYLQHIGRPAGDISRPG